MPSGVAGDEADLLSVVIVSLYLLQKELFFQAQEALSL
jgi:hypothetical protein